jgi:uncharacterized repeat protein (TIGR01451 family)
VAIAAAAVTMLCFGASALAATEGAYPKWEVSGDSGVVVTVRGEAFPVGHIKSDSTSLVTPSGKSTFLNDSTPFGEEFGSSRDDGYLVFRTASHKAPSTTTITFDSAAPEGRWGFVLGDIDADKAKVTATGDDGKTLPTVDLGWKGAFNYCKGSPLPPVCMGKTDSDLPTWHEADSTLVGHSKDTNGASGWFLPTKPVKKLTVVYSVLTGIPVGQLWIAVKPWTGGSPDIRIDKTASPDVVLPGGKITYRITVTNRGTETEPAAEFRDDLSDVLDNASYENDARATSGRVSYDRPVLSWRGELKAGQTAVVIYEVRVDDPLRDGDAIRNAVIGEGSRENCQHGRGRGCATVVRMPVFCRAAVGGRLMVPPRPAGLASRELAGC